MIDTKAEAYARSRRALEHVEEAQRELDRASEELSAVIHASPEYDRVRRLRERVHAEWYRLESALSRKRPRLDLDEMARTEPRHD